MSAVSVIVSLSFYLLKRLTAFSRIPKRIQQLIIGIVFGVVAIMGTEYGVNVSGAVINARDAAPLCAGLFFGGPAGIISGTIGGIWRWFAVFHGAGTYSRIACSVSTFLAGLIAALLRKVMLDNKRPHWILGFVIGMSVEIMHLTILFLTHINDPGPAFEIVKISTLPMVLCTSVSVMLSAMLISLCSSGIHRTERRYLKISQLIQAPLLATVIVAYIVSGILIFGIQTGSAESEAEKLLSVNLESMKLDIRNESDRNILSVAHRVADAVDENPDSDLSKLTKSFDVSEIYVINEKGIITRASDGKYIGYDMNSDSVLPEKERQSSCFTVLLNDGCDEYVQEFRPIAKDNSVLRKYAGVSLKTGGFIQVSYDLAKFQNEIHSQIKILTQNRHIGENGYILITDENLRLVSSDSSYDGRLLSEFGIDISDFSEGVLNRRKIENTGVFIMTTEAEGFHIISIMTENEVFSSRNNMLYVYSYMEILIFAVLFFVIYLIIKKSIVDNIRSVNRSLGKIIDGNLDTTVDVHTSEEFASLSDDINSTIDTLKQYIDEAASRIDNELAFAKSIQYSALPSVFPAFPNRTDFDIYAGMYTAREVGGDFYDFYFTEENKFAIVIADVSGKGIPAALFMMKAKTILKGYAESRIPVNEVFTRANEKLCEGNDADMFVTAWMGIIDLNTGHVEFANAGHNPPLICRKKCGPDYLKSRAGLVLAGMPGVRFKLQEFDLEPGDRIFLYTDGVTEASNEKNLLYGEDRLIKFIAGKCSVEAEKAVASVKADIDVFAGEAEQSDDITMLMFEYKGKNPAGLYESIYPADVNKLDESMRFVRSILNEASVPGKTVTQVCVAFEELFVNVASYAYLGNSGDIKVGIAVENNTVTLQLTDSGSPFNPLLKEDPDTSLPSDKRQIGGLGIFMVKKIMDEINYEYTDNKNILTVRKRYE